MDNSSLNLTPNKSNEQKENPAAPKQVNEGIDADMNAPYTDERKVVISLIKNFSAFRRANVKVLGKKVGVIGSSITSSRTLTANKGEIEAYMPSIIGISPSNPDFVTRVKMYFNNIQVTVTDNDLVLNTSFVYNHYKDYISFKNKEEGIENKFDQADKTTSSKLKEAIADKINALNTLESQKYAYGSPQNIEQYLIYRHCLLYSDVAKDMGVVDSSPNVRFYIKDADKEKKIKIKQLKERNKAMQNYLECCNNTEKFNAMFIQCCISSGLPITINLTKERTEKELMLDKFCTENPSKFNKLYNDSNLLIKAFIEKLIAIGELNRSEFNQNITSTNGDFIGANMQDAVSYFNNPVNKEVRTAYENKLKLL